MPKQLTPIEQLALLAYKGDKDVRDLCVPGKYEINTTVNLRGTLTIAADTHATEKVDVQVINAVCIALNKMCIDSIAFATHFETALRKADSNKVRAEAVEKLFGLNRIVEVFCEEQKAVAKKKPRRGAVSAVLFVDKISGEEEVRDPLQTLAARIGLT